MQANKFERQNRYVEKLKAEGLKRFQFWMKPEEKEYLMQVLDNLRNGKSIDIKESDSPDAAKINQLILNGHFHIEKKPVRPLKYSK